MSPLAESPPNPSSTATGFAIVTFDPVTEMLTVNLTYSGLASGATGAHIHCCIAPGGNVGVATTMPAFNFFVLGNTSGTFDATFDMTQAVNYNPAFITANGGTVTTAEAAFANGFVDEQTYLNIHDSVFPSGEIRLLLTPEPGTFCNFVPLAMLALYFLRKRPARKS
ncbi:MAG TPA: CHRD domain-containing protein [Bryobacteraceae bacterium]|nr:CHRD domain-containing protein [Bryobacteraceae bacterium]